MAFPFCDFAVTNVSRTGQRQAQSALIKQREFAHDVARVTLQYDDSSLPQYTQGTPVSLVWGWQGSTVNSFVGYVHHAQPQQTHANSPMIDVYLVGASTSLSQRSHRVFTNITVGALVARFAREHDFATVISADANFAFASLPQMNRTGWELLVWAAQQAGLALTCDKTTVYLQPRHITLSPDVPAFLLQPDRAEDENAVFTFSSRDGASTTTPHNVLTARGIDNQGNDITLSTLTDSNDTVARTSEMPVDRPVTGYGEAAAQISGQNALERFNIGANATISGHAYVRPATTVRLDGVGTSGSRYWWVSEAEHQVSLYDYRLDVVLASDSVPQPAPQKVVRSWTGRPQVASASSVNTASNPAATLYRSSDTTREALEVLTANAYTGVSSSNTASLSPARALALAQRPVPTRVRGALASRATSDRVIVPRYDSWHADPTSGRS
jgi:phage protein D